jgi:hypothetical protein
MKKRSIVAAFDITKLDQSGKLKEILVAYAIKRENPTDK